MGRASSQIAEQSFRWGFKLSFLAHATAAALAFGLLEVPNFAEPAVYSVTLEGGTRLGGVMQAPPEKEGPKEVPVAKQEPVQRSTPEEVKRDPDTVILKAEATPVPVKTSPPVKTAVPKKTAAAPTPAPAKKTAPPKPKEPTLDEINRELALVTRQYKGESANAGGSGYGAAALGGRGMGGGTLVSREVMEYLRTIERSVKTGWRWFDPNANLKAAIVFEVSTTGEITNVRIAQSSGNDAFDDSVVRAIKKANPLPVPPPEAWQHLDRAGGARITFDPRSL